MHCDTMFAVGQGQPPRLSTPVEHPAQQVLAGLAAAGAALVDDRLDGWSS